MSVNEGQHWTLLDELEDFAGRVECTEPGVVRQAAKELADLQRRLDEAIEQRNDSRIASCRWHAWHAIRFNAPFPPPSEQPPRFLQLAAAVAAWGHDIARELFPIHVCTAADPWTPEKDNRAQHPDAVEVGEQRDGWPCGDLQDYECPHCKHRFTLELPQ